MPDYSETVVKIRKDGALVIAPEQLAQAHIKDGSSVRPWVENRELRIRPLHAILGQIQERLRPYVAGLTVEQFIAEKRAEAARQNRG